MNIQLIGSSAPWRLWFYLLQIVFGSNTAQHQNLWRVYSTARHNDLLLAEDLQWMSVAVDDLHTMGVLRFRMNQHLRYGRVQQNVQIGSILGGTKERTSCAHTNAIFAGHLSDHETGGIGTIQIMDVVTLDRDTTGYNTCRTKHSVHKYALTQFLSSTQNSIRQWRMIWELRHRQNAASTMISAVHLTNLHIIFGFQKERQHILKAPSRIACRLPAIVVLTIASYIHHAIYNRCAAEYFATWPVASLFRRIQTCARLWFRIVTPIDVAANEIEEHRRNLRAQWFIAT